MLFLRQYGYYFLEPENDRRDTPRTRGQLSCRRSYLHNARRRRRKASFCLLRARSIALPAIFASAFTILPSMHFLSASRINFYCIRDWFLARAAVKAPMSCRITPVQRSLRCHKITERIEYELLSLTYEVLTTIQPSGLLLAQEGANCVILSLDIGSNFASCAVAEHHPT